MVKLEKDSTIRQETHDLVLEHGIKLQTHMEWEEKEAELRKEADETAEKLAEIIREKKEIKEAKRFTILALILSSALAVFIAVSAWLFLTVISNDKSIDSLVDKANYNKNQITYLKGRIKT